MRYSERAQSVIQFARQEAARLGHEHISTGHLLLGLIREGEGTAIAFLNDANVDLEKIKLELENTMESKGRGAVIGQLQITSRAKNALQMAGEESQNMGHKYIGTEHILIGLIREWEGVASKALLNSGIDLDKARSAAQVITVEEDKNSDTLTFQNVDFAMPMQEPDKDYYPTNSASEVLDLEEASQLLKIATQDLNELLNNDDLPARMINGQWRFSRDALIRWLGEGSSRNYLKK